MEHCAAALVTSIVAPLMNRIRCYLLFARKNKKLADQLTPVFKQIAEQLLPYYCTTIADNHAQANRVHHLVFLLVQKVKDSFQSSVIRGCLDQNWSLKGLKQTLRLLLKLLSISDYKKPIEAIENQIKNQNLQSHSCVTAFVQQVRQPNKIFQTEELKNLVECYETELEVVQAEITKFRKLGLPTACISTLNPWAYDLKKFDLQLIMDNDLTELILEKLGSVTSQVFWLTYFKCQAGVTCDEFFNAVKEVCAFSQLMDYYNNSIEHFESVSRKVHFKITLREHASTIQDIIDTIGEFRQGKDYFRTLTKFTSTKQSNLQIGLNAESSLSAPQYLEQLIQYSNLKHLKLGKLTQVFSQTNLDSEKHELFTTRQRTNADLQIEFKASDQDFIKDLRTVYDGESLVYRIGEGDQNEFQIPCEKKMWESQLAFICTGQSKFFMRDCGRVHPTRIQLSGSTCLKLQESTVIDLGNCIQFVVDVATHLQPTYQESVEDQLYDPNSKTQQQQQDMQVFVLQAKKQDKFIEIGDPPTLRLRTIWVNKHYDQVQKELILEATKEKSIFSIGRSARNDIQIDLKELSSNHCSIEYSLIQGWTISEKDCPRPSSNGTFVFMKSYLQMLEQEPSGLVEVKEGMVLSFVNYQLLLKLVPKSATVLEQNSQAVDSTSNLLTGPQQTKSLFKVPHRLNVETEMNFQSVNDSVTLLSKQGIEHVGYSSALQQLGSEITLQGTQEQLLNESQTQKDLLYRQISKSQASPFNSGLGNKPQSFLTNGATGIILESETSIKISQNQNNQEFDPVSVRKTDGEVQTQVERSNKLNQFPSEPEIFTIAQEKRSYCDVQTSTNIQKTIIADKVVLELAVQTDSIKSLVVPVKMFQDSAVSAKSLEFQQPQQSTDSIIREQQDNSMLYSQVQMVAAISLPEMDLDSGRKNGNTNTVETLQENSHENNRYLQDETLQLARVQYAFKLGQEDNKVPVDSDTD